MIMKKAPNYEIGPSLLIQIECLLYFAAKDFKEHCFEDKFIQKSGFGPFKKLKGLLED